MIQYTSASLFTGGGGADIGLENAGFKSLWGIERDTAIAQVAQLNFPHSQIINAAIEDVDPRSLPAPDLLWMSPPCQDYSQARRGDLPDHPDKDAGFDCPRYIKILKPRWVIMENVPGYLDSPPFTAILNCLKSEGYRTHHLILNAWHYGVPQDRKRLILWASRDRLPFFPVPTRRRGWYEAIAHLILELPDTKLAGWQVKRLEEVRDKLTGMDLINIGKNRIVTVRSADRPSFTLLTDHVGCEAPIVLMPRAGANINNCLPSLPWEPCPTIRAMTAGRHTHWADVVNLNDLTAKQITPEASALLQTFPETYLLPKVKTLAQRIIGNAVPPLLAEVLGASIIKQQINKIGA